MSKAVFKILKQCVNCGNMFESQKVTTKYCSHKCNSRHYKLRKRLALKQTLESEIKKLPPVKIKTNFIDIQRLKHKEFLSVKEVAQLFGCSTKTIYKMIAKNSLSASNLLSRLTRIKYSEIEQYFLTKDSIRTVKPLEFKDCYTLKEILSKYHISDNGLRAIAKRNNLQKLVKDKRVYYSKNEIDNILK